jgi:hypothetical protein
VGIVASDKLRRGWSVVAFLLAAAAVVCTQVNISGSVAVLTNAVQALTNKTLIQPTIADFANVQGTATDYEGLRILNTNSSGAAATTSGLLLGITNSVGVINTKIAAVENDSGGTSSHTDGAKADLAFYSTNGTGGTPVEALRIAASGNVGIGLGNPASQLHTTGTVRFASFGAGTATFDGSGNLSSSSDERLKNVLGNFDRGLAELRSIQPILYRWKSGDPSHGTYPGFSAQNVMVTVPEAVGIDHNSQYTLQDRGLIAVLCNAVKDLDKKVTAQQIELERLRRLRRR